MAGPDMGSIEQRMHDILARPETGPQVTLAALRELDLVPPIDGHKVRNFDPSDFSDLVNPTDLDGVTLAAPLVHLDPNTPFMTDGATGRSRLYSTDTGIATGGTAAQPAYFRLPGLPDKYPYLIIYFDGRQGGQQFTATLDLEVYSSGGSVRITATNNPLEMILSYGATNGARVQVPISLTTTADGYATVFVQRIAQTGFDWYGVDLR